VNAPRHQPFEIREAALGDVPGVAVVGELDLATTPLLVEHLEAAIRRTRGAFAVDLCDLDFLDSTGLHSLLRARALLGREDRLLVLICPPGSARRLLSLAGVDDLFALYETREEAAAAHSPQ
jgi:anti-anti-sigma factor